MGQYNNLSPHHPPTSKPRSSLMKIRSSSIVNGIAKISVNKHHKPSKGCQQTTLGDATLALHHANLLNVLMAIEKMMEPTQLTFLYIYIYDVPTESGADMLLEKNGVFAEATLKKVDLWWKWHFSFHLKSEEESKTFGLKAKQVGWSKANAACRSIKEESLKVKGHIYISREASRQVPYQNAITMVVTKFTPKKKKKNLR